MSVACNYLQRTFSHSNYYLSFYRQWPYHYCSISVGCYLCCEEHGKMSSVQSEKRIRALCNYLSCDEFSSSIFFFFFANYIFRMALTQISIEHLIIRLKTSSLLTDFYSFHQKPFEQQITLLNGDEDSDLLFKVSSSQANVFFFPFSLMPYPKLSRVSVSIVQLRLIN